MVDCNTRFNNAQKTLDNAYADPTTSTDRKKALEKSLELATTDVELAGKKILR